MKHTKRILVGVFFAALFTVLACLTACKTTALKLESGGKYTYSVTNAADGKVVEIKDSALWSADQTFDIAYNAVDVVFATEEKNEAFFWSISHDIKHTVDDVRVVATKVVKDYAAARTAYEANRTQANLTSLQSYVDKMQQLVITAQAALSAHSQTNAPPVN